MHLATFQIMLILWKAIYLKFTNFGLIPVNSFQGVTFVVHNSIVQHVISSFQIV